MQSIMAQKKTDFGSLDNTKVTRATVRIIIAIQINISIICFSRLCRNQRYQYTAGMFRRAPNSYNFPETLSGTLKRKKNRRNCCFEPAFPDLRIVEVPDRKKGKLIDLLEEKAA